MESTRIGGPGWQEALDGTSAKMLRRWFVADLGLPDFLERHMGDYFPSRFFQAKDQMFTQCVTLIIFSQEFIV